MVSHHNYIRKTRKYFLYCFLHWNWGNILASSCDDEFLDSSLNSQTHIHPAMMNFKLIIHDVYVSDICQKCTLYFCSSLIDICQKCNRLRQMPVVWMRFIYNSMHFRFGNNRCCLPRQEIICLFIYCTI